MRERIETEQHLHATQLLIMEQRTHTYKLQALAKVKFYIGNNGRRKTYARPKYTEMYWLKQAKNVLSPLHALDVLPNANYD